MWCGGLSFRAPGGRWGLESMNGLIIFECTLLCQLSNSAKLHSKWQNDTKSRFVERDPAGDGFCENGPWCCVDIFVSLRSPDKTSVIEAFGSPPLFQLLRFWGTADGYCWVRVNILTPWNILLRKLFDWKKMPWLTSKVYLSIFLISDRINIAVKAELIMQIGVVSMLMSTR